MNYPQFILNFALDTIFPIKCLGCGKFSSSEHEYLCKRCLVKLPIKKTFECIGCTTSIALGKTCFECRNQNSIDQLLVISDYSHPIIIRLIKTLKYRFVSDISLTLSFLVKKYLVWLKSEKNLNILEDNAIIIPLPLHYRRLNWRGFNQAEVIAKCLADILYCDIQTDLIKKVGTTKPQAEIESREERLMNFKENIFRITDPAKIKNKNIILIDDVCTTGTTLNQCAKVLKDAGAVKIIGFVIAKG